ncbi:glutathione synthase (plasmid) [Candidatus Megaera polyxenophila]|nr:glutathione synthase [Candidatus Megaera polyxenophila]
MILVLGVPTDRVLSAFSYYLTQKKANFFFANQDDLGRSLFFCYDKFIYNSMEVPYKNITGVFNRMVGAYEPTIEEESDHYYVHLELLNALLDSVLPNVVNRPTSANSNNSKPYQLSLCKDTELKIPDSFILANQHCETFNHRVIFKSVGGIRSIVKELSEDYNKRDITCPVLFQKLIPGPNIRVHIIGDQVFSLEIRSKTIDYRYTEEPSKYQLFDLPTKIKKACMLVTKNLGLTIAGIDLIRDDNENYYFLEANTSPAFTHFEEYMPSKPISEALMNLLSR